MTIEMDNSGSEALEAAFKQLHIRMNQQNHLKAVTDAAGAVMFENFIIATHVHALQFPQFFHHVYEWGHIGDFGFQLFKPALGGSGGNRSLSWTWKASKTTVPTEVDALGRPKFPNRPDFDPSKLNRVHVFVWKAPIMEYGIAVTIRPKLSKLLVFPNPDRRVVLDTQHTNRQDHNVTFSPHPYHIDNPGGVAQGQFSKWFVEWFTQQAPQFLEGMFVRPRNKEMRIAFEAALSKFGDTKTRSRAKQGSYRIDPMAAQKGKQIADLIAGRLERNYIAAAAQRKRFINNGDDE